MKFFAALSATIAAVVAAPPTATSPVDVKLEMVGNSEVKAVISNHGPDGIGIFTSGSIFDKSAVQKVKVAGKRAVPFVGIRKRISTKNVDKSAFQKIPAGQSVEVNFDIAHTHDLSSGGNFDISSIGSFYYTKDDGDDKLIGVIPYRSNSINTDVDGSKAAASHASFRQNWKRTNMQRDCAGDKLSMAEIALHDCQQLSTLAKQAAESGPADKMEEYFKASDNSTRTTVAGVFDRVALECGSTDSGISSYHCSDVANACGSGVLAYTAPWDSYMVYCDLYFSLAAVTSQCHEQDQATTVIHECTHLSQIQGAGDFGYGYDAIVGLSAEDALKNADTYAFFSNAIYANC